METFTFRIPKSWVGQISGGRVRAWIAAYVAAPHPLAAISEDLEERISLRLPADSVQEVVRLSRMSPSEALRRVITAGLRSADASDLPLRELRTVQPKDTDIISEELIGEDASGCIIIQQRDRRGFGYQRTIPIDRETYLKARRI